MKRFRGFLASLWICFLLRHQNSIGKAERQEYDRVREGNRTTHHRFSPEQQVGPTMTTGDSIFYYAVKIFEWLNPAVYLVGLGVAAWAFRRCRKWGYLVIAIYFALVAFSLLAMPSIKRALGPNSSAETEQKINAAIQEAIHKVLVEEGLSHRPPESLNMNIPLSPILLVTGLWLVARRETHRSSTQMEPPSTVP